MLDGSLNDFSEFLKFRFILFDTQRQVERGLPYAGSLPSCLKQGWARLKPGSWKSIWVSHMVTGIQAFEPSPAALHVWISRTLKWKS